MALVWSFKVFHTPHPLGLRKQPFSLSSTGLPSGACAKLRVWVLSYHNWGPEVVRNVLYNKARACAAAPLSFVWGSANRISIADSFKRDSFYRRKKQALRTERPRSDRGYPRSRAAWLGWGRGAWLDPGDCQALISNMVIGSRSPAGRRNLAFCKPCRGSPGAGGGVICSYLGQSL